MSATNIEDMSTLDLVSKEKALNDNKNLLYNLVSLGWLSLPIREGWKVYYKVSEQELVLPKSKSLSILYYFHNEESGEKIGTFTVIVTEQEIPYKHTLSTGLDIVNLAHYLRLNMGDVSKFHLRHNYFELTNQKVL